MSESWLVVGLGNPGPTYAAHRHNVGYRVVDALAARRRVTLTKHSRAKADVAETHLHLGGPRLVLARSRTFMNLTGAGISPLLEFYGVEPSRLVVVQDELDLPFESIRLKFGGGDNGHNGLKSLRARLGTGDYFRARLGTGRPVGRQSPADFLLSDYHRSEHAGLAVQIERAADAVEHLIAHGLDAAQTRYND